MSMVSYLYINKNCIAIHRELKTKKALGFVKEASYFHFNKKMRCYTTVTEG